MTALRKGVGILLLCLVAWTSETAAADRTKQAEAFVQKMSDDALALVTDASSKGETRRTKFRDLLSRNFDMAWIGQFVLGRHWQRATPDQRDKYLKLFEESIVFTYTEKFDEYSGQKLRVTGSRDDEKYVFVKSQIFDPAGSRADVNVEWRLIVDGANLRIVDVLIEGVSMSLTQRNEYSSVIENNNGKIDSLLMKLEETLANLRQRA